MSRSSARIIALLPLFDVDALNRPFAGDTVLGHTLRRLQQCRQLAGLAILHDPTLDDAARQTLAAIRDTHPVTTIATDAPLADAARARRLAARAFTPTAWRGGLGGATCYDEILAPHAMLQAMDQAEADAAVLVGPDWSLVDPTLCDAVIARHLQQPDRLPLVFTQAPPGLCGCLVARHLMADLAANNAMIGSVLEYSATRPQPDPIAKGLCVQIEPAVRDIAAAVGGIRAVCDTGRWGRLLHHVAQQADPASLTATQLAPLFTEAADRLVAGEPRHATLELTPRRIPAGPIVPHHHLRLDRADMSPATAGQIIQHLAAVPDITLTFGGLGDPLLHDRWPDILAAARAAGVRGVHIETDLLGDRTGMDRILDNPPDVLSVRLNADSAATYHQLMGLDAFPRVMGNIEYLVNQQRRRGLGLPWLVPRMIKTADNLSEIESFYDRWMHFCGHAVIDGPATGCGRVPDLSLLPMAPPRRRPCRQLATRLTILSNARLALCDQDWLGEGIGDSAPSAAPGTSDIRTLWSKLDHPRALHAAARATEHPSCRACSRWHCP